MKKTVVVLGAAGGVGSVVVRTLSAISNFETIICADLSLPELQRQCEALGDPRLQPRQVDLLNDSAAAIAGADLVVGCVGPFYKFGPIMLDAAIEMGVDYLDICDDLTPTRTMLAMHDRAKAAGITAIVGLGNSPGFANVFVKAVDELFVDELTEVDIFHFHGGEPTEGAAVIAHRIAAMVDPVPLYIDSKMIEVRQLEPDGIAHEQIVDFKEHGHLKVFAYPHPETITLPTTFPSLRRATNKGSIAPLAYFERTQELVRAGLGSAVPIDTKLGPLAPVDMAIAILQDQRPRLLRDHNVDHPFGALRVDVSGNKDGHKHTYTLFMSSESAGAGEGTGIPAAIGAVALAEGKFDCGPGVFPPEASVPVREVLALAPTAMAALGVTEPGKGSPSKPIRIFQRIDGGAEVEIEGLI